MGTPKLSETSLNMNLYQNLGRISGRLEATNNLSQLPLECGQVIVALLPKLITKQPFYIDEISNFYPTA